MYHMTLNEMPEADLGDDAIVGIVTLPDGTQVKGAVSGYVDGSGAYSETGISIEWMDGTHLTGDEWNIEMEFNDRPDYLWNIVVESLLMGRIAADWGGNSLLTPARRLLAFDARA